MHDIKQELKIGDAVSFEYRDTYDRETGTGIVVGFSQEYGYKVALIQHDKEGWYWTDYWSWNGLNRLTPLNKRVEDYGLFV